MNTNTTLPKRSPFAMPVVLGLLDGEPQHGYALFARIQRDLSDVWHVGMNRLYALLEEMEADGLIAGHEEQAGNRPARRVFRPTAKGKRVFERWLHEPSVRMNDMRIDFPPKLYFAMQRGRAHVASLVDGQRAACEQEMTRMASIQRDIDAANAYRHLVYEMRVRQIESIIGWLNTCERELGSKVEGKRGA